MTNSPDSTSDPAGHGQSEPTPVKRKIRIEVRVAAEEHQELRRRAAVRGMNTGQYIRAAGLGQPAYSSAFAELAREAIAIGHAVMQEVPERGGERERLLDMIRPVLRRINSHLP